MRSARRQHGVVLVALLAVIVLGASWFLVSKLNAESAVVTATVRNRNAETLNRAKQALIGYVAMIAARSGEDNPGRLPCPEAAGYYGDPINEGIAAGNCTLPKVGRFPWRTIGTDRLVDVYGEPLWYVVSPGWAYTSSNLTINSNTTGQLTVDGVTDSVALIIAPGPAINVTASTGCSAISQTRPTSGTLDASNYLECENATGSTFVTTKTSSTTFNDQVVKVTAAEILPGIEAAIANRIEREIAPKLKYMYNYDVTYNPNWSGSSATPWLPFAATFADPTTSAMQGASGLLQGLLPLTYAETNPGSGTLCTAGSAPRCNPTFVNWTSAAMSGASIYSTSCTAAATQIDCTYYYWCSLFGCGPTSLPFTLNAAAGNVGMAMRRLNTSVAMTNVSSPSATGILNADGSASIALSGTANASGGGGWFADALCGLGWPLTLFFGCKQNTISVPITLLADHSLLDSLTTGSGATGWFLRNKWHEVTYYAIASGFAPGGAKSCTTGSTCLTVNYHTNNAGADDSGTKRAILILSGRALPLPLPGQSRPSASRLDYLEGANSDGASPFEIRSATLIPNRTFNDRVAVIDSN